MRASFSALVSEVEEMRQILDEDGYLFVKGLLPRDDVVNMRRQ